MHSGPDQARIQTAILVQSLAPLVCFLHPACFAHALCCAHLFARTLTLLTPKFVGQRLFFLCFSLFWTIGFFLDLAQCIDFPCCSLTLLKGLSFRIQDWMFLTISMCIQRFDNRLFPWPCSKVERTFAHAFFFSRLIFWEKSISIDYFLWKHKHSFAHLLSLSLPPLYLPLCFLFYLYISDIDGSTTKRPF